MTRKQEDAVLRITARYVAEVQAQKQPRLSDYVTRYPQYSEAIVDFVTYYHAIEENIPANADGDGSFSDISRSALQYVQKQLLPLENSHTMPITTLRLMANGQSLTLSDLAQKLNLSIDIIIQLERRMIDPATIPHELRQKLAVMLQYPTDVIETYFAMTNQAHMTRQHTKYSTRVAENWAPYPPQEIPEEVQIPSFRQALEDSVELSAEQATSWYDILTRELL